MWFLEDVYGRALQMTGRPCLQMVNSTSSRSAFITDLINSAHRLQATGINFDWETGFPFGIINPFLTELTDAMHNATPPLQLSYDAGSANPVRFLLVFCWF